MLRVRAVLPAVLVFVLVLAGAGRADARRGASGGAVAPAAGSSGAGSSASATNKGRGGGGAQAPSAPAAGGSEYGVVVHRAPRPVVARLSVPASVLAGAPPRTLVEVREPGVATVFVRALITDLATRRIVVSAQLGWVRTGRTLAVRWPAGARLRPGSYRVSVSAHDHHGGLLLRSAHASGRANLLVRAPAPPGAPAPTPLPAGVPTPAQSAAAGAVFPVAGPHSFGDAENRFGAARSGHVHEGQDVLAAEGLAVVAPLAGTVLATGYQAGGAGYYVVERTRVGFDFMFAHCGAGSTAVALEAAVTAGQGLCRVGATGDASGPHLHFEMWVGGWQAARGYPIDPLPYLEAW